MSNENQESVRTRVTPRLLEATDRESLSRIRRELIDGGEKEGSVDAVISELRKRGHFRFNGPTTAVTKPKSVEELIKATRLPDIVDGNAPVFDAGVQYGMNCILVGVRVAQELSKMGIEQAGPLIKMAQELRAGAGEEAKIVGKALAEATLQGNAEIVEAIKSSAIAQSPNPILTAMGQAMAPLFSAAFGNFMGMFGKKAPPGQPGAQASDQPGAALGQGFEQMSDEERKQIFGGQ